MSERRILALLALLLGLLGALLVLIKFRLPGGPNPDFLGWLGDNAVRIVLGLVAIGGSLLMYGAKQQAGGIINVVVGIALLLVGADVAGSLLIIFSGILGLVAAGSPPYYSSRR